jgi:hypothetical protein
LNKRYWTPWLALLVIAGFAGFSHATQTIQLSDSPSQIKILDNSESGLRMQVTVGSIELTPVATPKGEFTMIRADGLIKSFNVGEPNLPVANRLISIPFGCELVTEVEAVTVKEISLSELGITAPLMPAQPSLSKSVEPEDVAFEFNDGVYETDAFYALPQATAEILGTMRSVRIGLISASPMEYNPVTNVIRVCTDMTVRVSYLHPDWDLTRAKERQYYSPVFEPIYDMISNYEPMTADKDPITEYPIKYVIVSDRMFESQLQPFIEWKTEKGFVVETYYTDSIGTSNTVIKTFLQNLYQAATPEDPAPSYVLLVGDAQQIQPFAGSAGDHITDLRFCEFTGDNFPEIMYGRFSAQNPTQLQPQIDKTLEYEQYQMPDPSYLGEVTLIAGVDGTYASTYGNGQINYGTTYYFNAEHGIYSNTWLYPASDGSGVNTQVIQTINDGLSLANYTAHCGHDSWSDPYINTGNVQNFTNYHKYLLGIGNCCLSNTFGTDYSTPCFGEVWMQLQDRGGIGYIGGTNSTYWDEDYWWGVGYGPVVGSGPTYEQTTLGAYDGLFHDHGEPVSDHYITNDAVIYAGNMAVSQSTSSKKTYYWEIYHLMGDPSVMTYLGVPATNDVIHPDAILMTDASVSVTAEPASYVGISVGGEYYGSGYVDESGTVDVDLKAFAQPCLAEIVVTAQNKQPYIDTIQVIAPSGPYVVYSDDVVDDMTGGNGNGLIDYGESVILGMEVKNVGPDTAFDVNATLTTEDSYITITDDAEFFGTIAGDNEIAYSADAFSFDVSPNVPDGHRITFTVTMTDANDSVWASSFSLTAHAPVLTYAAVAIDDNLGNDNGVLDPGESATLTVSLANGGSGQADDVTAVLSESDPYVSIGDADGTFGQILPGAGGDNAGDVFSVSADASCPRGHEATLTLTISAANGYETVETFSVIVGDRVVFFSDDFSFDQGWTGLGGSGEWTIGPATGGTGSDSYGGADPATDHSPTGDNGVLGNDLTSGNGGDYSGSLGSTYWVTSPALDCSDFNGVLLNFYRWLGVEQSNYDHVYLQVYDGSSWTTIFQNGGSTLDESSWSEYEYDVSQYADSNPDFQIRFGMGPTDGSMNYCGWNIDDVMLKGYGERTSAEMVLGSDMMCDSLIPGDAMTDTLWVYNMSAEATLRVRFSPDVPWVVCDGDQQLVPALDSLPFEVTLTTAGMDPGDHVGHLTYVCNDYSQQYDTLEVLLYLYAPEIDIATASVEDQLESGATSSHEVVISNIGPGRLEYTAGCQMFGLTTPVVAKPAVMALGTRPGDEDKSPIMEPYYAAQTRGFGGPDAFGYNWVDSDEPGGPTYGWVDISGVGTPLSLGDDAASGELALGFDFPYYDAAYASVYVGSNGILTFGGPSTMRTNTSLPTATAPNNLIALWWDDLDPGEGGSIYYYADAANQRFIVSFEQIQNYIPGGGTGSLTCQAILDASGEIVLQYAVMDPGQDADGLTGSTIGIENAAGDDGLTVVYNAAYMHDNLAIRFNAQRWMSLSPGSGTIEPYSSDTVTVTFNAADLETGTYTGQVVISSNDLETPEWTIPVSLTVQSYVCGDANGDGDVNVSDAVYLIEYIFKSGPPPDPLPAGDADGNGDVNIADAIYLINYIFKSGPPPIC